jgi:hypothetical protein
VRPNGEIEYNYSAHYTRRTTPGLVRPSQALNLHRSQIRGTAMRHRVAGVRVFDSAIHGDDVEGSDLTVGMEATRSKVALNIVWATVTGDLPGMKAQLASLTP